jgi:hypothetical protein
MLDIARFLRYTSNTQLSETGLASFIRCKWGKGPTQLGPLGDVLQLPRLSPNGAK